MGQAGHRQGQRFAADLSGHGDRCQPFAAFVLDPDPALLARTFHLSFQGGQIGQRAGGQHAQRLQAQLACRLFRGADREDRLAEGGDVQRELVAHVLHVAQRMSAFAQRNDFHDAVLQPAAPAGFAGAVAQQFAGLGTHGVQRVARGDLLGHCQQARGWIEAPAARGAQ